MPGPAKLIDHLFIKIGGSDLPRAAMDDLVEVTVDTSLRLPDMFTIHLHDEGLHSVDDGPFELGKEVEISAQPDEGNSSRVLLKGEITALEPEFGDGTRANLLVRGYDRSHRLHRGTNSKAYLQVTDSDLAARVAQDAGLSAQVDPTTEVYDHVLQYNQTPMDFISERAERIGYEFFVEDKTLHFQKPKPEGAGGAIELEWGNQLHSFRPRLSLVEQVDEVIVKGWDPKMHQTVVGQAGRGFAEPKTGFSQNGGQLASAAFKPAKRVVVSHAVKSQAEADTLAQAILDRISGGFIQAEGVTSGQPDLRAGKMVTLKALGKKFSGTFFVTAATHTYRAGESYMTSFSISGRRPESLTALIESAAGMSGASSASGNSNHLTMGAGIVTNNNDPERRGRVKVRFPWLSDDVESDWARVVGAGAGPERGLYILPEINDEVLVGFEQGDVGRPYVLGGLWNGKDLPPARDEAVQDGRVHGRILATRAGHKLTFVDDHGKRVVLETAGGHRLTLDEENKQVILQTTGGHVLTLDDSKSQVSLESTANLDIKSRANLNIEAGGTLTLKGQVFSMQANATGEVKATGALQIQGGIVKIN